MRGIVVLFLVASFTWLSRAAALDEFEQPPIAYSASKANNSVSKLQEHLASGEATLGYEPRFGYLRDLLKKLQIDETSQILVFSKTSEQRSRIAPRTPRAIYFNDDVYVGYCHNGEIIEISSADPKLGAVFYSVDQTDKKKLEIVRESHRCLQCHAASPTGNLPGFMMRSVFVSRSGLPILSEGGSYVDDSTQLEDRWGGWYVTGKVNQQSHLGNRVITDRDAPRPWNDHIEELTELNDRIPVKNYLCEHSDVVALMVFGHQTYVHNLITQANFTTRQALHYQVEFNRALGNPVDEKLESVIRRIATAGDRLVAGLLFADEASLNGPIYGSSSFAKRFAGMGPHDSQGRSLREFDLTTRLFKYPCSFLIYSRSFDELPDAMKSYVSQRLKEVLQGGDEEFSHLSAADREAIYQILQDTKPDLWDQ